MKIHLLLRHIVLITRLIVISFLRILSFLLHILLLHILLLHILLIIKLLVVDLRRYLDGRSWWFLLLLRRVILVIDLVFIDVALRFRGGISRRPRRNNSKLFVLTGSDHHKVRVKLKSCHASLVHVCIELNIISTTKQEIYLVRFTLDYMFMSFNTPQPGSATGVVYTILDHFSSCGSICPPFSYWIISYCRTSTGWRRVSGHANVK